MKPLMTVAEACAALSVGRTTLYGLVADGSLVPVRIRRCIRFHPEQVEALRAGRAAPEPAHA